jgi:hypothetical protein
MAFFDYLEQLRKKPVAYRKRVAFFGSVALTVLIFMIWLSTWSAGTVPPADSKDFWGDLKPIEEIKNSTVSFYSSVVKAGSDLFGGFGSSSPSAN